MTFLTQHAPAPDLRREHSAIKEAGSALNDQIRQQLPGAAQQPAPCAEGGDTDGGPADVPALLHSVKLACRGVVALKLTLPEGKEGRATSAVHAVRKIIRDVESGARSKFKHVHRIVPFQTSTSLGTAELQAAAARLASSVAGATAGKQKVVVVGDTEEEAEANGSVGGPKGLTFAVAFNGRGGSWRFAEQQGTGRLPERMAAIGAIATGFTEELLQKHGIKAKVDLKNPGVVLLAEVLPLASDPIVGLAAVPASLCSFAARTNIKTVGDTVRS